MSALVMGWDWPQIAVALIWKLAPKGFVLYPEDMILPRDRVLFEDREPERIILSFVTLADAKAKTAAELGQQRATVSELQGRWQKIAICTLWHFAVRGKLGKRDSITLTVADSAAVPAHLQLMASGHGQGVEWRFLPRTEAKQIADWDRDNEGLLIQEKTQL